MIFNNRKIYRKRIDFNPKMPSELKLFNSNHYTYQLGSKNNLPICFHLHRCSLIYQKANTDFLFPFIFFSRCYIKENVSPVSTDFWKQ